MLFGIFLYFFHISCKITDDFFVHFRDIQEPKNVKLLFDVLRFEPPSIHRAVLFVTNNALVCETPEDASRVAYDLDRNKNTRYDVRIIYDYSFFYYLHLDHIDLCLLIFGNIFILGSRVGWNILPEVWNHFWRQS